MTYRVFKKPDERSPSEDRQISFGRRERPPEPAGAIGARTLIKATALTAGCAFLAFEIVRLL